MKKKSKDRSQRWMKMF